MVNENVITVEPIDVSEINEYSGQIETLREYGFSLKIKTHNDYEKAAEFLKKVKGKYKELETRRKGMTSPLDAVKKSLIDLFKPSINTLSNLEQQIKNEMVTFANEQERIRREAEAKLREAARKEEDRQQKLLEARAKKAEAKGNTEKAEELREKKEEVYVPAPVLPSQPKVSGISYKVKWRAEIVNVNVIPKEYLIPDMQALNKVAEATKGRLVLPGVVFRCEKTVASKSS